MNDAPTLAVDEPGTAIERADRHPIVRPAQVMTGSEIDRLVRVGMILSKSSAFKGMTAELAFTKILLGRELGLSAPQAMMGLYVVEGNIMVAYPMLGQFIRARDGYDFEVTEHDETRCTIRFTVHGVERGVSTFTIEDAQRAKLIKDKSAWTTHPRNMLYARAMSNGVKWYVPEVVNGMPIYVEDEIQLRQALDAGEGDGSDRGLELPEGVEMVITRARRLGYLPLANRGVVEIAVGGRTDEFVAEWCARAHQEITDFSQQPGEGAALVDADAPADGDVTDAEVVPEDGECTGHEWGEWIRTEGDPAERFCLKCNTREREGE